MRGFVWMGAIVWAGGAVAIGSRAVSSVPQPNEFRLTPSRAPRLAPGAIRTQDAQIRLNAAAERMRETLQSLTDRANQAQQEATGGRAIVDSSLGEVFRRALVRALMPHVEAISRYQSRSGMNTEGSVRESDIAFFESFPARYADLSARLGAQYQSGLSLVRQRAAVQAEIESLSEQLFNAPSPEQRTAMEARVRTLANRANELRDAEAPIAQRLWAIAAIGELDDRTAWNDEPESVRVVVRPPRPVNAPESPGLTMSSIPVGAPFSLRIRMKTGIGPDLMRCRFRVGNELRLITARRDPNDPREFSTEATAQPALWWSPGGEPPQPPVQP